MALARLRVEKRAVTPYALSKELPPTLYLAAQSFMATKMGLKSRPTWVRL
jgi:hypothetical protein